MRHYLRKISVFFLFAILSQSISWAQFESPAAAYRGELRNLHVLHDYRAMKNSFVLGLEETASRPPLIHQGDRKTILDVEGQGSLRHIWETDSIGHIGFELEFFIDGEKTPSIHGKLDDLLKAAQQCEQNHHQHAASIIPNRSHNWYLPVPFDRSLRVDVVAKEPIFGIVFLQLDYRLEDESLEGVRLYQTDSGVDIQLAYRGAHTSKTDRTAQQQPTRHEEFRFSGNGTVQVKGPGVIRRLSLNKARRGVRLRMRYDGESTNAVAVDSADFFGPFRGTVFNNNACYFPMPFKQVAEVEIAGASPNEEWTLELDIEPVDRFEDSWGYFHAVSNHARTKTTGYDTYDVLYTRGRGHWLGMNMYDTGSEHGGGDFAVIDGETDRPAFLHGVNGEDYYSFAYFATGENFPYTETFSLTEGRMRVHLDNPYPFHNSLHISWGTLRNQLPRSVTYWYQDSPKNLTFSEQRESGLLWQVFGQRVLHDLGNLEQSEHAVHRALLDALPTEADLDAGKPIPIAHHFVGAHQGTANGWADQVAAGPHLNLMYVYRHHMDLGNHSHMGSDPRAMMARTTLASTTSQQVTFQLSYDDPLEVFLNGEPLFSDLQPREGYVTHRIKAKLTEGENRLLVKLIDTPNNNTAWAGLSLRVLDLHGDEIAHKLQPPTVSE